GIDRVGVDRGGAASLGQAFVGVVEPLEQPAQVDPVRTEDLRMRVEDQAQHRGPGARQREDEDARGRARAVLFETLLHHRSPTEDGGCESCWFAIARPAKRRPPGWIESRYKKR